MTDSRWCMSMILAVLMSEQADAKRRSAAFLAGSEDGCTWGSEGAAVTLVMTSDFSPPLEAGDSATQLGLRPTPLGQLHECCLPSNLACGHRTPTTASDLPTSDALCIEADPFVDPSRETGIASDTRA